MWSRFDTYRHQKRQVDQWDMCGEKLKALAGQERESVNFKAKVFALMGVNH